MRRTESNPTEAESREENRDDIASSNWAAVKKLSQNIPGFKVDGGPADSEARPRAGLLGDSTAHARSEDGSRLGCNFCLLEQLPPKQAEACVAKMVVVDFSAGENIVDQGSVGTSMYFLDTGKATAYVCNEAVRHFGPGEFFGELAFISTAGSLMDAMRAEPDVTRGQNARRSATVRAMEHCRCLELSVKDFASLFEDDVQALGNALRVIIQQTAERFKEQQTCELVFNGTVPSLTFRSTIPKISSMTNIAEYHDKRLGGMQRSISTSALSGAAMQSLGSSDSLDTDSSDDELDPNQMTNEKTYLKTQEFLKTYVSCSEGCGLLDLMSDGSRMQCIARMRRLSFQSGEKIIKMGHVGDTIYLISTGKARAMLHDQVAQELGPGSYFGEIAFLATCSREMNVQSLAMPFSRDQLRTCDVVASEYTEVWELTAADFLAVVGKNPDRNRDIIQALSRISNERIVRLKRMVHCPNYVPSSPLNAEPPTNLPYGRLFPLTSQLSFTIHRDVSMTKLEIMRQRDVYFFSSSYHEAYVPFCEDDGPVNLSCVAQFCWFLRSKVTDPRLAGRHLAYYSTGDQALRSNAIFLLGAYMLLVEGFSAEKALRSFDVMGPNIFRGFRDALPEGARGGGFRITLSDLLRGLSCAVREGWFHVDSFDLANYVKMDDPGAFDLHQPCPKLVAFRGPDVRDPRLRKVHDYYDLFKEIGITAVVRLNEKESYNRSDFIKEGIKHYDLEFPDCTFPSKDVVMRFFEICDKEEGGVAVHCRAGLGRTGTLIALWMMRGTWRAREAIAWLRIVRPGSVLGCQQEYLEACEDPLRTGRLNLDVETGLLDAQYRDSIGDDVMSCVLSRQHARQDADSSRTHPPPSHAPQGHHTQEEGDKSSFRLASMRDVQYPLLSLMSEATRRECLARLRHRTFRKKDVICKRGMVGEAMYFVKTGVVQCLLHSNNEGTVVQELEPGAYFGEIAFLGNVMQSVGFSGAANQATPVPQPHMRTCDVVAACDCELWELSIPDFIHCINVDRQRNSTVLRELSNSSRDRISRLLVVRADCAGLQQVREALTCNDLDRLHTADGRASRLRFFMDESRASQLFSIIPKRLSFALHRDERQAAEEIERRPDLFFFSSVFHDSYVPLRMDDGPVNLAAVVRFCHFLQSKLTDPRLEGRHCVYYSEMDAALRSNAVFLLGAYLLLVERYTLDRTLLVFESMGKSIFRGFRDASSTANNFRLSLRDCLSGLMAAAGQGWLDIASFDVQNYLDMDNPAGFDLHQVCPKIMAFRGPDPRDTRLRSVHEYCGILKELGATAVVRVNEEETYAPELFTNAGIRHYQLDFPANSHPPEPLVQTFLDICDKESVLAVHCRAGLGRTGTLIARYLMARCGFKAREAIAWQRVVMPGCVRGGQQQYLTDWEALNHRSPHSLISPGSCAAAPAVAPQQKLDA